jgi:hypothetical protein
MSLDVHAVAPRLAAVLLAEDDTEESVRGSDLHQEVINESHMSILEYAEEVVAGWYVSSQVTVIVTLPDRDDPWRPKPDLFVVPGVPSHSRTSYDTRSEGPMPPFVLEVASEGTWRHDVGRKAILYGLAGVQEYLVFDPAAEFLGEQVRAWRSEDGGWRRWHPTVRADGTPVWESRVLGLALRPEALLLRFDHPERGTLPIRRDIRRHLEQERLARQAAEELADRERQARQAAEEQAARTAQALAAAQAEIERLRAQNQDRL